MGNICGKTESDNFSSPGRVVGAAPPSGPQSAPVPKTKKGSVVSGPGRTLGSGGNLSAGGPTEDARKRAAEAAEVSPSSPQGGERPILCQASLPRFMKRPCRALYEKC